MDHGRAVRLFAALAQEHRLAIVRLLVEAGPSGLAAGEVGRAVGLAPTGLSFHLKELAHAGLLRSWRVGRSVRYAVEIDQVRGLVSFLTQDCCKGAPDLCGLEVAAAASGLTQ